MCVCVCVCMLSVCAHTSYDLNVVVVVGCGSGGPVRVCLCSWKSAERPQRRRTLSSKSDAQDRHTHARRNRISITCPRSDRGAASHTLSQTVWSLARAPLRSNHDHDNEHSDSDGGVCATLVIIIPDGFTYGCLSVCVYVRMCLRVVRGYVRVCFCTERVRAVSLC